MKINTDFVTNSSSTSFILQSCLSTELYGEFDFKVLAESMKEEHRVIGLNRTYGNMTEVDIKEDGVPLSGDSEIYKVTTNIQIIDHGKVQLEGFEVETNENVLLMTTDFDAVWDSEEQHPELYLASVLKEILKAINYDKKVKASYHQHIKEYSGDGWDGDPQGKYTLPSEAMLQETKVGTLEVSKDENINDVVLVTEWTKGR